jgi:hypothetical protein
MLQELYVTVERGRIKAECVGTLESLCRLSGGFEAQMEILGAANPDARYLSQVRDAADWGAERLIGSAELKIHSHNKFYFSPGINYGDMDGLILWLAPFLEVGTVLTSVDPMSGYVIDSTGQPQELQAIWVTKALAEQLRSDSAVLAELDG